MKKIISENKTIKDFSENKSNLYQNILLPRSHEEVRDIVLNKKRNIRIRTRGNGHSMNSMSIPRKDEILISMEKLDQLEIVSPDECIIEPGVSSWDSQNILKKYGIQMPVYNDGKGAASSIGGYLSAGGIGYTSNRNGGFWNWVKEVTMVTAQGETKVLSKGDTGFEWLFGSMGQLGIITRIKMETIHDDHSKHWKTGKIHIEKTETEWEKTIWFTLFVPRAFWKTTRFQLIQLGSMFKHAWKPRTPYVYQLPFKGFTPPLIHSHQGDLTAVGIWGEELEKGLGFDWKAINMMELAIRKLVASNPGVFRRYAQAEAVSPDYYRQYFQPDVMAKFSAIKSLFDPDGILNPGIF